MKNYYRSTSFVKLINFSKKVTTLILLISILLISKNGYSQTQQPNVIFILGDDIGYEIPTVNGGQSYQTPNIGKMAEEGMRFTQCHATPLCSPSRFMLLTGKYNFRNYSNWGLMDLSQRTIGNMFSKAGYATACYGKWQNGGGDTSLQTFGFDHYCVWDPLRSDTKGNKYKNPHLFVDGSFVNDSLNVNKYGDDIFTDSVINFINKNKANPFFIYYPMVLCHTPQSPTPYDTAFASWNPTSPSDTAFFPSMVKYMDEKIGQVIDKVKSLGIEKNTIIIYVGDNGTTSNITSFFDEDEITGGKAATTKAGTHVPLLIWCPDKIMAGSINDDLIDFTDFLPTLADICGIPKPLGFGTLDGISFAPRLTNKKGTPRSWVFCHFNPHPKSPDAELVRWAQNKTYKLYDSAKNWDFYNVVNDPLEQYPISDSLLSYLEDSIKSQLQIVLDGYGALSLQTPVLSGANVSGLTHASARLGANIITDNNSPIISRGTVYDIRSNVFANDNPLSEGGNSVSAFTMIRTGFAPQSKFFFRGYAINDNGFGLSEEDSFYTFSLQVIKQPTTFLASFILDTMKLHWSDAVFPLNGAKNAGYLLIYSTGIPSIIVSPNGQAPTNIIQNGTVISIESMVHPKHPPNSAYINSLEFGVKYNFLLVPYTWDGENIETYNYLTADAKTVFATVSTPNNPVIKSISPSTVNFEDGKFILSVNGTNFYQGLSTINWNGIALATTYIDSTKLKASVDLSYLAIPGVSNITVATIGLVNVSNTKIIMVKASLSPLFISDTINQTGFFNICLNTETTATSFLLSGSNLSGSAVSLSPLAGFSFSKYFGGVYTDSISINDYGTSLNTIIYVRFKPLLPKVYKGNILVSGGGAATIKIPVMGSGTDKPAEIFTLAAESITATSVILKGETKCRLQKYFWLWV